MLLELVAQASLDAGRTLRVLERRTQAQDHPILLTVPETHYLKCLIWKWCKSAVTRTCGAHSWVFRGVSTGPGTPLPGACP